MQSLPLKERTMLTDLLTRRSHVRHVIKDMQAKVESLARSRDTAQARLRTLRAARDGAHGRLYDERARLLLSDHEAERRRIEGEIAQLETAIPGMDAEIAELEGEILPRLQGEQAAAEREVRLEVFRANSATADTMTQVPHALEKRWNTGVEELVEVLGNMAAFNGGVEWWTSTLSNEARARKVDAPRLPAALPLGDLLQTLQAALRQAWRDGQARGEAEAGQAYLNEPRIG